ncbi:MAG: M55 family metallopeptidase [Oscillospiraceae bacterium]
MKDKFYIGVDCEGVACAVGRPYEGLGSDSHYQFAQNQAIREANAAAAALFEMGAKEVYIWDNHSSGVNFDYNLIDERCKIVMGSGHKVRFPKIDDTFAGVLFIGYHSRDNVRSAVLAHTYSSKAFQSYSINGVEVGEMQIDAAFAGEHNVPVIFVSSDDKTIEQAKETFPWIKCVEIKESLSWNSAISLHPKAACNAIYEQVKLACKEIDTMQSFTFQKPIDVAIRYKRLDEANNAQLFDKTGTPFAFLDAFTRTGTVKDIYGLSL